MLIRCKTALALALVSITLSGCASNHSRADDAIGGVIGGAAAGAAIGALCCGDPVHGLPAGMLIGGIAGGGIGFLWPPQ